MRSAIFVALPFLFAGTFAWGGCANNESIEGPPTVPLKGRIQATKGASVQKLADASVLVEFESVQQPQTRAFGIILEDGSFTMKTQVGEQYKEGVVAGKHRVRLNTDDSGARFIAPKFLNFETSGITVEAPSDKEVVIQVWN